MFTWHRFLYSPLRIDNHPLPLRAERCHTPTTASRAPDHPDRPPTLVRIRRTKLSSGSFTSILVTRAYCQTHAVRPCRRAVQPLYTSPAKTTTLSVSKPPTTKAPLPARPSPHCVRLQNGCTPIHSASFNGHVDVVKVLLDAKMDKDLPTKVGRGAPAPLRARGPCLSPSLVAPYPPPLPYFTCTHASVVLPSILPPFTAT